MGEEPFEEFCEQVEAVFHAANKTELIPHIMTSMATWYHPRCTSRIVRQARFTLQTPHRVTFVAG